MSCVVEWIENGEARSRFVSTDVLTHRLAPVAERFWAARPSDGIVIGRDIPSRPIAHLLSHIVIYQPVEDRSDLKVHLAGTAVRFRFSRDITGAMMSELFGPEDFPVRFRTLMEVIDKDEPRRACITHTAGGIEVFRLELLMIPVWSPGRSTRWAASFCFYT
jgi:hypothetical protein